MFIRNFLIALPVFFAIDYDLPAIIRLSDTRKSNIRQRVKEKEFDFDEIRDKIEESEFLKGKNPRGWKVDFDFVFGSKDNYLKILENKYKNSNGTHKQQRNTLQDFS